MIRLTMACCLTALLSACAVPVSTTMRPDTYYDSAGPAGSEGSLFSGDAGILSDDEIQEILAYQYKPPRLGRIALMPFGREVWSTWSEELALASERVQTEVIDKLRASPNVYDASYLPSILIPESRTVPRLREAAARYQADLLLVYRSYCQSFDKYGLFSADRSRAYCGVEAILLDTRSGLVPFTTVATRSFAVIENKTDTNFRETQLRAQLDATADAMGDISTEIVEFLRGGQ